jgi:hypothetical protein
VQNGIQKMVNHSIILIDVVERVAFCTGNGRVYMWSVEGCSCVDVPAVNFRVQSLKWNSTGEVLALKDVNNFCCCYPPVNAQ